MKTQPNTKRTNSLWPAAYCLTQGVKLLYAVKENGQRAIWIMDDTDQKATAALNDWYQGDPLVGGRSFLAARSILLDAAMNPDQPQTQHDDKEIENAASAAAAE